MVIFLDKKMFTVDQSFNRRNSRAVISKGDDVPAIQKTKHPQGAMVLGVISSDGKKCPPYFFPCGFKIGAKEYLEVMEKHVLPWLKRTYPQGNYIFQQDSALGHKAKTTQEWLKANLAKFWPWSLWPPSSPDCNPLDYGIWGVLEVKVGVKPYNSVQALKSAIKREWNHLSSDFIVKTCKNFRGCLEAVIEAKGGHF